MHAHLNIPLTGSATTRRDSGRVAALVGGVVFGACVGLFAFRAPFMVSTTVAHAPDNAATLRILHTHGAATPLNAHLGNHAIFPGAPWAIRTLLAASNREMTIALLPNGEMAYIIDAALSQDMQNAASAFGMQVAIKGNTSIISPSGVVPGDGGWSLAPSSLLPWHMGEVTDGDRRGTLRINNTGITLGHTGIATENARPTVPEGTTVTAYLTGVDDTLEIATALAPLMATPVGAVLDLFGAHGGTLLLTQDALGDGYVLTTSPGNLTSEQLATIGKDIMDRASLSTQAWTIEDGSTYTEIVGAGDNVTVEIRAEEDFTYVSLKDPSGNTLRMTKTPDSLTISNREIAIGQGTVAKSRCLSRAHSWVTHDTTLPPSATVTATDAFSVFTNIFSEIAIGNSKIRLCW